MSSSRVHTTFTGVPPICLGQDGRFQGEVALRLAPEATAQQRDVDRDIVFLQAKHLRDVAARSARALHAGPDFGFASLICTDAAGGSIGACDAVRNVVLALDDLVGACQGLVDVAFIALDLAGLARLSPASAP